MTVKKAIRKLHLWLGLSSGLLVLFLGVTGCILAFQREIENATQPYQFVAHQPEQAKLPPSVLQAIADKQVPGKHAHSVSYEQGKASKVVYFAFEPEYYYIVYLNPYTGQLLKVKNMDEDFFRIVIMGHFYLWLPPEIGQPIVTSATAVFLLMLISGLVLWWPKNKSASKQRFSIKWSAKWKRRNYDLHNVLGFYMTWVAIFTAITGMVMGFQWFAKSVYFVASGGEELVEFYEPTTPVTLANQPKTVPAVDRVWQKMLPEHHQTGGSLEVHIPHSDSSTIETAVNPDTETFWRGDYRYFNQHTLEEVAVKHPYGRFAEASVADKLMRMNYDIHVGAIAGLPGKIIAFFASLIAASLPVTGFLIWRGREHKKKQKAREKNLVLKPV